MCSRPLACEAKVTHFHSTARPGKVRSRATAIHKKPPSWSKVPSCRTACPRSFCTAKHRNHDPLAAPARTSSRLRSHRRCFRLVLQTVCSHKKAHAWRGVAPSSLLGNPQNSCGLLARFDTVCEPSWVFAQVLLSIPGDVAVTKEDVAADTACVQLASGRSELVGLALWLVAQRCKVSHAGWLVQQLYSWLLTACSSTCQCLCKSTATCPNMQALCEQQSVTRGCDAGQSFTMARFCTVSTSDHELSCPLERRATVRTASRLSNLARSSSQSKSPKCGVGQHS